MLTRAERKKIKAVTRLSVEDCGGQEAAQSASDRITRHQSMHDFGNNELPKKFISIDTAAELDRFSGAPHFARLLADLSDHILLKRPDRAARATRLGRITGQALKETSEVFAALGASLEDERITKSENETIAREIDEAIVRLFELRDAVHAEADEQGEPDA